MTQAANLAALGTNTSSSGTLTTPTILGTNGLINQSWTTAGRPSSPVNGQQGYNTSNSEFEVYTNGSWKALTTQAAGLYTVQYVVVAGGGSGGGDNAAAQKAAGAGAGGLVYVSTSATLTPGSSNTVTVGAGGAAQGGGNAGVNGSDSSFLTSTANRWRRGSGVWKT